MVRWGLSCPAWRHSEMMAMPMPLSVIKMRESDYCFTVRETRRGQKLDRRWVVPPEAQRGELAVSPAGKTLEITADAKPTRLF